MTNAYLTRKEQLRDGGDTSERTFQNAVKAGKRFAAEFGKARVASNLQPDDFAEYRVKLAKTRSTVSLGKEIRQARSILKFAYDEGMIATPIRFGTAFKKPSAKVLRIAGARYRQGVEGNRLEAVEAHVRAWLFPKNKRAHVKKTPATDDKRAMKS